MWYLALYAIFALWVLIDGLSRKLSAVAVVWAAGTLLFGPLVLPIYLAKRPLKTGEVREGGTGWNVLKNFAILWTLVMVVAAFSAFMAMGQIAGTMRSDAERAGAGIGMVLGMGFIGAVWFFPVLGATVLGFLLKKNSIVENGPTGPLVGTDSQATAVSGWGGLVGTAIVALVVVGVLSQTSKLPSRGTTSSSTATATGSGTSHASTPENHLWNVSQKKNDMDGTKQAFLQLDADNEIPGIIGNYRPYMIIQCKGRSPELVINVGQPIQHEYGVYDTYAVRVKFDEAAPVRQRWTGSTNNEALFAPSPTKLIGQLVGTKVFLFEFTPFEKTEQTVTFKVEGLKQQLDTVSDICHVGSSSTAAKQAE